MPLDPTEQSLLHALELADRCTCESDLPRDVRSKEAIRHIISNGWARLQWVSALLKSEASRRPGALFPERLLVLSGNIDKLKNPKIRAFFAARRRMRLVLEDAGRAKLALLRMAAAPRQSASQGKRRCYERDHTWLRWNEEEEMGEAAIRDR